jgi:Peptidase family M23
MTTVGPVFSKRTRVVGLAFCLLWVLLFTGQFRPVLRWLLEPAAVGSPRAFELQYLPWANGKVVHVNNGNNGPVVHSSPTDRYGWDFEMVLGEPVRLGIPGIVFTVAVGCPVVDSWTCNNDYGNTVTVRVADGTCARFAHLSTVAVVPGQAAGLGALVGAVGSSGRSTAPHLHYHREDCATRLVKTLFSPQVTSPIGASVGRPLREHAGSSWEHLHPVR